MGGGDDFAAAKVRNKYCGFASSMRDTVIA
jgi:hypothetical protein